MEGPALWVFKDECLCILRTSVYLYVCLMIIYLWLVCFSSHHQSSHSAGNGVASAFFILVHCVLPSCQHRDRHVIPASHSERFIHPLTPRQQPSSRQSRPSLEFPVGVSVRDPLLPSEAWNSEWMLGVTFLTLWGMPRCSGKN